jgi:hypothetical protein
MFPAANVPIEYERILQDPFFTNPSAMHRPSISLEMTCVKWASMQLKLVMAENGMHTLRRMQVE